MAGQHTEGKHSVVIRDAEEVLAGLDPEQREVAANPLGPMCVLAGAGTGKTRAITHRIAYGVHSGVYSPDRVLAVTFTARAAGELRTRLRQLGAPGVQARTFHAAALRQLQYFWPQAVGGPAPQVMAHKAPAVAEAAGRLGLRIDRTELRDLASEIEWAKVSMLTADDYRPAAERAGRRPAGYDPGAVARLIEEYEVVKTERGTIDFEDVLLLTVGILADQPRIADVVQAQYRHFVVDEYQDVNLLQQRLLEQWVGDRPEICVVGDPAQTIYTFTGASSDHLTGFTRSHPGTTVVRLVRNYRSTPQILHLANALATAGSGSGAVELTAQSQAGSTPRVTSHESEDAEATAVADTISAHVAAGGSAAEVAVLYRTNAQSEALEQALTSADIGYQVRGAERFFARAEVRQAMVLLRGAARSADESADLADVVGSVLSGAGWSPRPPTTTGATRERWESLQALVSLAADLDASATADDRRATLPELIAELDRRANEQHPPSVPGVTLASLHAAKGLEWDVVHIIGCSEGLIPISAANTPGQVEEERRLLYVGVTRARRDLHLSYATGRSRGRGRRPSRFLTEMGLVAAGAGRPDQPRRSRRSPRPGPAICRTCGSLLASAAERKTRRCASCPPTYDQALYDQLREWRSEQAKQQEVPAYVVFTDATLTAIAETRPLELEALSSIPGVGPVKLERYGPSVVQIITAAGTGHQAATKSSPNK